MAASPGFRRCGAVERGQCGRMLAQHREAAGQVDLGGGLLGQELGGALQRLARLGETAELQSRLAQQMQRLAGIGPRLGDLRQQRLGAGEVAGGGALHGVARQRLDLEVGEGTAASALIRGRRSASGKGPSGNGANQARQNGFCASNRIWLALRPRSRWVQ